MNRVETPWAFLLLATWAGCDNKASTVATATAEASTAVSAAAVPSGMPVGDLIAPGDAVKKLREGVQTNPEKYDNKPVKLVALQHTTNIGSSGGKDTYGLALVDSIGTMDSVMCRLGHTPPPEGLHRGDVVEVEGTGRVSDGTDNGKKAKLVELVDCKIMRHAKTAKP